MEFTLGVLTGITISILIVLVLMYLRRPIEQRITTLHNAIGSFAPRPHGYIIEPDDEAEATRKEIIARNKKMGRATKLEELL